MAYTYYTPEASEYKPRLKDKKGVSRAMKRKEQVQQGLIKDKPGVQTEQQKKNLDKLGQVIGKKEASKIGNYTEAPGGGTPLAKGTKAPSDEWVKENRKMQPRDPETGEFETNAANAKETKYPPRGNSEKRKSHYTKWLDKVFKKAAKKEFTVITDEGKVALAKLDMTKEEFVEAMQHYHEEGFTLKFKTSGKRGARSKYEKEKMAEGNKESIIGEKIPKGKKNGQNKYVPVDKVYNRSAPTTLTDREKATIAPVSQSAFKQQLVAAKDKYTSEASQRSVEDNARNKDWKAGNISKDMQQNLQEGFKTALQGKQPTPEQQKLMDRMSDPANIQKAMQKKNANGEPVFETYEEYRHWAMGKLV